MAKNKDATRTYSLEQEKLNMKLLDGKLVKNSGASIFGVSDGIGDYFVLEAKTTMTPKKSFTIQKKWLDEIEKGKISKGKELALLAFNFEHLKRQYYVLNQDDMLLLLSVYREYLELLEEK